MVSTDVTVSDTNPTSLTVSWTYPSDSEYTGANITCVTSYDNTSNCEDKTASKDESSVSYDGLIPGVEYKFIVTVVSNGQLSTPSSGKSITLGNKYLFVYKILICGSFFRLCEPLQFSWWLYIRAPMNCYKICCTFPYNKFPFCSSLFPGLAFIIITVSPYCFRSALLTAFLHRSLCQRKLHNQNISLAQLSHTVFLHSSINKR